MEQNDSTQNTLQIPSEAWWQRVYYWMCIGAAIMAILTLLVFLSGVADLGGWRHARATVHVLGEDAYEVSYSLADGTTQVVHEDKSPARNKLQDGQSLLIRYRVDEPERYLAYSEVLVLGICLAVATIVLLALGISMWREDKARKDKWQRVKQDGVPVVAEVLSVYADYTAFGRRNRTRFSRLDCAYVPDAQSAQDESGRDDLWLFTSERFLTPQNTFKGHVTVYVRPNTPDEYYVDLNTLVVDAVNEDSPQGPDHTTDSI